MPINASLAAGFNDKLIYNGIPIVSGGTLVSDANYHYRVFTSFGTLTVKGGPLKAEQLIIAGGGGGRNRDPNGWNYGVGGASSGGVGYIQNFEFYPQTYNVVVPAGGSASDFGGSGDNHQGQYPQSYSPRILVDTFYNYQQAFGGRGAEYGSGGNPYVAPYQGGTTGIGTLGLTTWFPEYANTYPSSMNGGDAYEYRGTGGGGGGSGEVGQNASNAGGRGGNGTSTYSDWLNAIKSVLGSSFQTAVSTGRIAAGGGGSSNMYYQYNYDYWGNYIGYTVVWYGDGGDGGSGGGGKGAGSTGSAISGVASTGSGGGAGHLYRLQYFGQYGGNGGSGLIVFRYPKTNVINA